MKPLKIQKVSDKMDVHSVTAVNQSILFLTDSSEEQLNTNVDEEQDSGNLRIKKLNHDCLAQVLMHLSVLARLEMEKVCIKWEEATQMSSYNFKKINFNDLKITLDKKEETWRMIFEKYGRYLTDLTITYDFPWICNVIRKDCHNLIHFDIDGAYEGVSYETLLQLIMALSKLKYLKVKMSTKDSPNFFTQLLCQLPNDINEIHLISINFGGNNNQRISAVSDKFTSLRCLTLQGFDLDQSIMDLILLNANTLYYLDLSNCDSSPDASIFPNLCNLEYLNLSQIKNLNFHVITAIAHNCQKLNHFEYANDEFDEMDLVPQRVFSELKYLINLENLNFQGLDVDDHDDNFLSPIVNNCKKLKHLNIDRGVYFAASNIKEIKKLKNLQSIELQYATLNSELLIYLANNCLELKNFNAIFHDITGAALGKLINLKKLEKLEIYKCGSLTGNLLIDIVINCKNLIDLDLCGCHNVTEASLLQVGKLKNLKRLNIDRIKCASNAMFDNFNKLEYLSCFNCPSVTDQGITKVLDNCQNLVYLNVYKSGVSVESLIYASKRPCVIKMLRIIVNNAVKEKYNSGNAFKSPYLHVR